MNTKTAEAQAQERIAALLALQEVAHTLSSELDLEKLLRKILRAAIDVLQASTGSLLIWDPETDELVFTVVGDSEAAQLEQRRIPADQGIAGWVFTHRQPIIVDDVHRDERFFKGIDESLGFKTISLIAAPLMTQSEIIGVIEVLNKRSGECFDEQDLDILTALAVQAAIAIVNARLYQELREERDRILAIEAETQKKLARDLHDGPAQTLAAMIMNIDFITRLLQENPDMAAQELAELRKIAVKTLQQVRNTMFELRPVVLETQGLVPALEHYVDRLRQTEPFAIHLQVQGLNQRLPSRIEHICFAIIQEALGNIKKHAQARNAWINLEKKPGQLILTVADDGKGFNVHQVMSTYDQRGSLGLLNIRERAEMLNAELTIKSSPGKGTVLTLVVPLPPEEELAPPRRRRGTGPLSWPS